MNFFANGHELAEKQDIVNPNLFSYYDPTLDASVPAKSIDLPIDFTNLDNPIIKIADSSIRGFGISDFKMYQTMTLSFEAYSNTPSVLHIEFFGGAFRKELNITNELQKFSITDKTLKDARLFFWKVSGDNEIEVQKVKLEVGNATTSYTRNWKDIFKALESRTNKNG